MKLNASQTAVKALTLLSGFQSTQKTNVVEASGMRALTPTKLTGNSSIVLLPEKKTIFENSYSMTDAPTSSPQPLGEVTTFANPLTTDAPSPAPKFLTVAPVVDYSEKPVFICGMTVNGNSSTTVKSCEDFHGAGGWRMDTFGRCMTDAEFSCGRSGDFNWFMAPANCNSNKNESVLQLNNTVMLDYFETISGHLSVDQTISIKIPDLDYLSPRPQAPVELKAKCTAGELKPYLSEEHSLTSNYLFQLNETLPLTAKNIECTGWISASCKTHPLKYLFNVQLPRTVEEGVVCGARIKKNPESPCLNIRSIAQRNVSCAQQALSLCENDPDLYFSTAGNAPSHTNNEISVSTDLPKFTREDGDSVKILKVRLDQAVAEHSIFLTSPNFEAAKVMLKDNEGIAHSILTGNYLYSANTSELKVNFPHWIRLDVSDIVTMTLPLEVHYRNSTDHEKFIEMLGNIIISFRPKPKLPVSDYVVIGVAVLSTLVLCYVAKTVIQYISKSIKAAPFKNLEWNQLANLPSSLTFDWNDADAKQCGISHDSIEDIVQEAMSKSEQPQLTAILKQPISQRNNRLFSLRNNSQQTNRVSNQFYKFDEIKQSLRVKPENPINRQPITISHLVKLTVPSIVMEEIKSRIANREIEEDPEADLRSMMKNYFANTLSLTRSMINRNQVLDDQGIELNSV
ncbi:MAG: hypothetical protein V4629_00140 [Pseudomonadota bacterium]